MIDGTTGLFVLLVLLAMIGVLIVAAAFGFRSFFKQRIMQHHLARGLQLMKDHRATEALGSLLKAEAYWHVNLHNGNPKSFSRDVDQFSAIAKAIFKVLIVKSGPLWEDVNATVAQMKALLADRSNFGIDGRSMQADVAPHWHALCERIELLRPQLRAACEITFPK